MKLLPPHLRRPTITDTNYFKRHLKSFLFTESLLGFLDKLYSGAMQITDCIVLYCIVLYAGSWTDRGKRGRAAETCIRLVLPSGDLECTRHLLTSINGRTRDIFDLVLWSVISTFEYDVDSIKLNQPHKYRGSRSSRSKVIAWTHIHQNHCSVWTTKVVGND